MNTTLELRWLSWADYANKYPLMFSSGEQFDMAYAANWLNFYGMARKGAYMPLEDLWEEYAPDNYALQSEEAKTQATVDGHIYGIPTLWGELNSFGPIYRADLLDESQWDGKMENFEDLEEYLDLIKANYPEMEPFDLYSSGSEIDYVYFSNKGLLTSQNSSADFLWYDPSEEQPQIKTFYDLDGVEDFLTMMNRWNEKGFFTKSALADTDSMKLDNGKAAAKMHNIGQYVELALRHPEWEARFANFVKPMSHSAYTRNCLVLPNTCKDPERCLALWNLLTTDRELYDAFFYGVEGTTYELDEKGNYRLLDTELYALSNMWAVRNPEFIRNAIGTPDGYDEWIEKMEAMVAEDKTSERYAGFVPDFSNIETEVAMCNNVVQQYWWPLELGYTDPVTGLEEFKKMMEAAGIDKVIEEIQGQLDAYVETLA